MSIFLITALRAVGIPARMVGTPEWAFGPQAGGNHDWVEVSLLVTFNHMKTNHRRKGRAAQETALCARGILREWLARLSGHLARKRIAITTGLR